MVFFSAKDGTTVDRLCSVFHFDIFLFLGQTKPCFPFQHQVHPLATRFHWAWHRKRYHPSQVGVGYLGPQENLQQPLQPELLPQGSPAVRSRPHHLPLWQRHCLTGSRRKHMFLNVTYRIYCPEQNYIQKVHGKC